MKPSNEFTSPDQRFFYPANGQVEHHESFDTVGLPAIVIVEGQDHFTIVVDADGEELGCQTFWRHSLIPEGAVIKQLAATDSMYEGSRRSNAYRLRGDDLAILDREKHQYTPQQGDRVMVRLSEEIAWRNDRDDTLGSSIFVLPHDQPMPSADELGLRPGDTAAYELVGFLDEADRLIVPRYLSNSPMGNVIDWCIANALAQNGLEHALLRSDLHGEATLLGRLAVNPPLAAYLRYFDEAHGQHFTPSTDPDKEPDRFAPLTDAERAEYSRLTAIANLFLSKPRFGQ